MKKYIILFISFLTLFTVFGCSEESDLKKTALAELGDLSSYSEKTPYSPSILSMYLGYDNDKNPCRGIAFRKFKTYKEVTAMLVLEKKEDKILIRKVDIPDITLISDPEKREKVLKVLDDFRGKTVRNSNQPLIKTDAVSGATRYYNAIYATFNLMIEKTLAEMDAAPAWKKIKVNS